MTMLNLRYRSLWREPLGDYDVVYCFLSPAPMAELWAKARREMRPGSLLVSNSFPIEGVTPDAVIEVPDRRRTRLYLYRPAGPAPKLRTTAWAPRPAA